MHLEYCKTNFDKFLYLIQIPFIFIYSKLFGRKLFEFSFLIPVNGVRSFLAFLFEKPENFVPDWFKKINFSNSGVFVDVGSNLGFFSVYYTYKTGRESFAFEINPYTAKLLSQAIKESKYHDKIKIISCGLSDSDKELLIFFDSKYSPLTTASEASKSLMEKTHGANFSNSVFGRVKRLDYFLTKNFMHKKINLIKIDVEGMEIQVITGALATIKKNMPLIIFESNISEQQEKLKKLLKKQDYRIKALNQNNYIAHPMNFEH